jgi:hypothetical protein
MFRRLRPDGEPGWDRTSNLLMYIQLSNAITASKALIAKRGRLGEKD